MNVLLAVDYYNSLINEESHMFDAMNGRILNLSNQTLGIGSLLFVFAATLAIMLAAVHIGAGKKGNGSIPPKTRIILTIACCIAGSAVVSIVAKMCDIGQLFGS